MFSKIVNVINDTKCYPVGFPANIDIKYYPVGFQANIDAKCFRR